MKPRFILPALAVALATGGAFLTLHAQDTPLPKTPPGPQKQFRFEFRDDGSGPRFFRNGQEVKPGENGADPFEQMRDEMQKEMEDLMRKHMGEGQGQGGSSLDDLLKQLRERSGQKPQAGDEGGGIEDLFRRIQRGGHGEPDAASRYCKEHRSVLAEWRPMVKAARESTVRLTRDSKQIAFATVVSADGYALTKASEVKDEGLEAEFQDGRIVSAKVVDKLDSYDLALIKLEATGLTPAKFSAGDVPVGTLVAAVGVDEDPLATGVISIAARSLSEKGKGALGIAFKTEGDDAEKGVSIGKIIANCPAGRAGLKANDAILSINGTAVEFPFQLQKIVSDLKPGDSVKLRYARDGKEAEAEFALTSREELNKINEEEFKAKFREENDGKEPPDLKSLRLDPTARMSGSLSANAGRYPNAVQSDLTIDGPDCGGPVVDVDGNIVALSIERPERVSTYLLPGKVVLSLLANVQSGKFTLAKDADTLRGELRESEEAFRKAQEAMKAAEASRAATEAELKKLGQ